MNNQSPAAEFENQEEAMARAHVMGEVDPLAALLLQSTGRTVPPSGGFNDLKELRADFPNLVIMPPSQQGTIIGPGTALNPFSFTLPEGAKMVKFSSPGYFLYSFKGNPDNPLTAFSDNTSYFEGAYNGPNIWTDWIYCGNLRQVSFRAQNANQLIGFAAYIPDRYVNY